MTKTDERIKLKKMLEANDYTLEEYFMMNKRIIIPLYQRGYDWEEINIDTFIKDICNNNDYYIGNIMALPNRKNVELIDGQQRIISTYLILCSLKNKFNLEIADKLLAKGNKIKIENRAPSNESRLLKFIYADDIPKKYKGNQEVKIYERITKTIVNNAIDPKELLKSLLTVMIVEIRFIKSEADAHNMFVNLNTKGKTLENIDILKSQLFKYLCFDERKGKEYYKEGWYETIQNIGEKNAQRYFDNFNDLYLENNTVRKIDGVINKITNFQDAEEYFDNFSYGSSHQNCLCKCAMAVYSHSIMPLENIYDGNISLDGLNNYLKLLEKAKFRQFDVVLIPLLHVRNKSEKTKFINNYQLIINFFKFVLMHQEIMSINKSSPSQYGTDFKKIGRKLFLKKEYKKIIKEFLESNFNFHSRDYIINTIKEINIDHNNTYHAKQIIMLVEENINTDMTIEHFIAISTENNQALKIGNCIPVKKDSYSDKSIDEKLKNYQKNAVSEPYIKKFLETEITKDNYIEKLTERTNKIAQEYADIYEKLYEDLTM